MVDPRNIKLAKILVDYSVYIKKDEKVLINCYATDGLPLAKEIYKEVLLKGAYPYLDLSPGDLQFFYFNNASFDQLKTEPEIGLFLANWADKYIAVVAEKNSRELANIDPQRILLKTKANERVKEIMLKKPWVITYYPTYSMAQGAKLSLEEMEDLYYTACLQDWSKEAVKLSKLKKLLDDANEIKVIGEKTNLILGFKNRKFKICAGEYNMPDGEIFSAPQETIVGGYIYFDFPSLYQGKEVYGAEFVFKQGKVINFDAKTNKEFLTQILKIDLGAKSLGEFAIGTNYGINRFMFNTLFDEKIGGTIHLALGSAYPEAEEGGGKNQSAIHWDFVKDMRKKGSQVLADGKAILKDGKILV